jgi:Na+/proline symporter
VLSIAGMLAFVALYSTTGGIRSVIATDVVQRAKMVAGAAIAGLSVLRGSRLVGRYGAWTRWAAV